jgi:aminoglycoside phosphotransferase family enzyme
VNADRPAPRAAGPPRAHPVPGLDAKVAFLREPASYPDPTFRVVALETHMSWVFLLDRHVYKLKKPVCYELLDFRSLGARRHYCDEELRLNRRLAPSIYLGLVPLTCNRRGHLALGGRGRVVDWLVRMVRLPHEQMFDFLLARGAAGAPALQRLAQALLSFYQGLPPEPLSGASWRERFRNQIAARAEELQDPAFDLPARLVRTIERSQVAALAQLGGVLAQRAAEGRVVEGHGDLRPEHIWLGEPVAVIDCLEFSRELRLADSIDEVGFLALECERLGNAAAGAAVLHDYLALCGDEPPAQLMHFYQSCRASTRALIAARHMRDERFRHSPHWLMRAAQYLDFAERHAALATAIH